MADPLTLADCLKRWPCLARTLQWCLIGSRTEAGACLRDYRLGLSFSCEAVSHAGQTPLDWIRHAIRCRHLARQSR